MKTNSILSLFAALLSLSSCSLLHESKSFKSISSNEMPDGSILVAKEHLKTAPSDWKIVVMNRTAGNLANLAFVSSESKITNQCVFWVRNGQWLTFNLKSQPQLELLQKKFAWDIRLVGRMSDSQSLVSLCEVMCIALNGHVGTTLSNSMRNENPAPWLHGRLRNKLSFHKYCVDPNLRSIQESLKLEWNQIKHDGSIERWTMVFKTGIRPKILELKSTRLECPGTFSWGLAG